VRCESCGERIRKDDAYHGDEGTFYSGKPLCETCYEEDEPCATVFYGRDDTPYVISHARNETDNDFRTKWISTDPWRGYFQSESDKYTLVNTAELLSYHESEEMLADFDKKIRRMFDEHDIDYARLFARSSNVFYQNYDLYVKKEHELPARLLVAKAKQEADYDNPEWRKGIIFDEHALNKLTELFPEEGIQTDYDAVRVVEKYGDEMVSELKKRMHDRTDELL
jgi:hypothetical protein